MAINAILHPGAQKQPNQWHQRKNEGIANVSGIPPLGNMSVATLFHFIQLLPSFIINLWHMQEYFHLYKQGEGWQWLGNNASKLAYVALATKQINKKTFSIPSISLLEPKRALHTCIIQMINPRKGWFEWVTQNNEKGEADKLRSNTRKGTPEWTNLEVHAPVWQQ